jgi:5-methylcytosine-specific restriction enzyme A
VLQCFRLQKAIWFFITENTVLFTFWLFWGCRLIEIRTQLIGNEYVCNIDISTMEWEYLLLDKDIFYNENIETIKKVYLENEHRTTCKQLGLKYNIHPQTLNHNNMSVGKRIIKKLNRFTVIGTNGKETFWSVCMKGRKCKSGLYEWQLREELVCAIENLNLFKTDFSNITTDNELVESLIGADFSKPNISTPYSGIPKEKEEAIFINSQKLYKRNKSVSQNALAIAKYLCEIDNTHPTFLRKNFLIPYTEPHHLVPLEFFDSFFVSLDIEENIVSLCSNCHNRLHYGDNVSLILFGLLEKRKTHLQNVGICITLDELLKMY